MATVAVVGLGAWGTALAAHAARLGHTVRAWAREPEVVADLNAGHENVTFLPGVKLPDGIAATTNLGAAVAGADLVLLVPPSKHLRSVASGLAGRLRPGALLAVATKGIEEETGSLMSEVLAATLPEVPSGNVVFLSGPSFAKEVATGLPTNVVAGCAGAGGAAVQRLLHSPRFRVYTSSDPVGVQVGGAVKNVIAVAAGACDGMGMGTNARAALITRGLAEITRLGVALGANPLTFLGMSGVGDLILTCTGALSRNRELGLKVAQGVPPEEHLARVRSVAEGYFNSASVHRLAQKRGVDMPITEQVYQLLHCGRPLAEAMQQLLGREHKDELHGISG